MLYDIRWCIPYAALITTLCCYIPIMNDYELIDLHKKQQNETFERIVVGSLSCAFPLVLDVIMNFDLPTEFVISRWLFLSSLILPNILMLASGHGNTLEIKYIVCSNYSREILVIGGLLNCLHTKVPSLEISRTFFFMSACITMILGSNYHFVKESHQSTLLIFVLIFRAISFIGISLYTFCFLYYLYKQNSTLSSTEKYCGVLACLLLCNHIVRIFFQLPLLEYTAQHSNQKSLIDTISAVLGFILPSRIAIENAALSKVSPFLIDLSDCRLS